MKLTIMGASKIFLHPQHYMFRTTREDTILNEDHCDPSDLKKIEQMISNCRTVNEDKILKYFSDQGKYILGDRFFLSIMQDKSINLGPVGNCDELARIAFRYVLNRGIPCKVCFIKDMDHVFLVIGEGSNAVICDPWTRKIYPYRLIKDFFESPTHDRIFHGEAITETPFSTPLKKNAPFPLDCSIGYPVSLGFFKEKNNYQPFLEIENCIQQFNEPNQSIGCKQRLARSIIESVESLQKDPSMQKMEGLNTVVSQMYYFLNKKLPSPYTSHGL